ncbi:MAG: hypothetical protein ACRD2T_09180, partial [Thermoanaerobaculia bacterium]
ISRTKRVLDAQRARLAAKTAQDPAVLEIQIDLAAEELNRRLVEFINAEPPRQGAPLTSRQREALRLRSDEDIRLAREYIEDGGDYRRALEILRAALLVDPGNPRLAAEVTRAESGRYMSPARFSLVKEGMTAEQVRALLGAPNPHNVRDYPARGPNQRVVAWFYPKDAAGSAAAVWLALREAAKTAPAESAGPRAGLVVYQLDFDAVQARPRPPARSAPPAPPPAGTAATG